MADYNSIKQTIENNITTNNNQEITAQIMRETLDAMLDEVNASKIDTDAQLPSTNIADGAITGEKLADDAAVKFIPQTTTDEQKNTARENIDVYSKALVKAWIGDLGDEEISYSLTEQGYYVKGTTGKLSVSSRYRATNYVDISGYDTISFLGMKIPNTFYDSGFSFFSAKNEQSILDHHVFEIGDTLEPFEYIDIPVPQGAKYFRTSVRDAADTDFSMVEDFYITGKKSVMDKIDEAKSEVKEYTILQLTNTEMYECTTYDFNEFTPPTRNFLLMFAGVYGTDYRYKCWACYVVPNGYIKVQSTTNGAARFAFLKSYNAGVSGGTPDFSDYDNTVHYISKGNTRYYKVPSDAVCALFGLNDTTTTQGYKPALVEVYYEKGTDVLRRFDCHGFAPMSSIVEYNNATDDLHANCAFRVKKGHSYLFQWENYNYNTYFGRFEDIAAGASNITGYEQLESGGANNAMQYLLRKALSDGFVIFQNYGVNTENTQLTCTEVDYNDFVDEQKPTIEQDLSDLRENVYNLANNFSFEEVNLTEIEPKYDCYLKERTGLYMATTANAKRVIIPVSDGQYIKITANSTYSTNYAWFTEVDEFPEPYKMPPYVEGTSTLSVAKGATEIVKVPAGANFISVYLGAASNSYNYAPTYFAIISSAQGGGSTTSSSSDYYTTKNYNKNEILGNYVANTLLPLGSPFSIPEDATDEDETEGTWSTIDNLQLYNAYRKAKQMVNIKFTPVARMPRRRNHDYESSTSASTIWYEPNVDVYGMPYSANNEIGYFNIEAFMTAVHNPYSLMYSERVLRGSGSTMHSDWGKKYYMNSNAASYYGLVCCSLTSLAIGSKFKYDNPAHDENERIQGSFVSVYPHAKAATTGDFGSAIDFLKPGDILDNNEHSIILVSIKKDANGNPIRFHYIEESSVWTGTEYPDFTWNTQQSPIGVYGGMRDRYRSYDSFKTYIQNNKYIAYRYLKMYENIEYEPSVFAPLAGETFDPATYSYNEDICTFGGNKAQYMQGNVIVINYNIDGNMSSAYDKIIIKKDGVEYGQYYLNDIDTTNLPDGTGSYWTNQVGHALVFDGSENGNELLPAGDYEAYLSNSEGTQVSQSTYFNVLSNVIAITKKGTDKYQIKYSGNGQIDCIMVGNMVNQTWDSTGNKRFDFNSATFVLPSVLGAYNNTITIYPKALVNDALSSNSSSSNISKFGRYIKVCITGKYGGMRTPVYDLESGTIVEDYFK